MTIAAMAPPQLAWHPLLDGETAARARAAVAAIATSLQALAPERRGGPTASDGRAGIAILFAYLARAMPGRGFDEVASDELGAAAAQLGEVAGVPSLFGGFTSVGWAVEHLRDDVDGIDAHTSDGIDDGVLAALDGGPWRRDYDLISGLVGLGVYALERMPHGDGARVLERVIDRLDETAEARPDGATWWTRPELLSPYSRRECPRGWYNLGLAHGVPGVIALLAEAYAAGVARARVAPLLDRAVRWVLAQRQPDGAGAAFPLYLRAGEHDPPRATRLAWCYGDLGAAAALWTAAQRINEPAWETAALAIARRAAARPVDQAGVRDAGLCHGAAGLAHLFNRFHQASGEAAFADAARTWFTRTLAMRVAPGAPGLGGYRSWGPKPGAPDDDETTERVWYDDPALLTGATGIALALVAAITPIEPRWDRLLLTCLPRRC